MAKQNEVKFKINRGFITQRIKNKTTVFSGEESILFTLNDTAAYIFNGLKLNWPKQKIVEGLNQKYQVDKKAAERDIDEIIIQFLDKKILVKK